MNKPIKCTFHSTDVPAFPLKLFGITVEHFCILCGRTQPDPDADAALAPYRQIVKKAMEDKREYEVKQFSYVDS